MKQLLTIIIFCLYSFGISAQTFTQKDINDSLRTGIEKEIYGESGHNIWVYPYYYQNLRNDISDFVLVMLVVNPAIDSITINIPSIAIYGNYQKRFAHEGGYEMIYSRFHDIYSSLFSFPEIDAIQVYDCWDDCRNITYLPIKSDDYITRIENACFRRAWYIPELDYYDLLGHDKLTDDVLFNADGELLADILDKSILEYKK